MIRTAGLGNDISPKYEAPVKYNKFAGSVINKALKLFFSICTLAF
jgi:hypothetical protein